MYNDVMDYIRDTIINGTSITEVYFDILPTEGDNIAYTRIIASDNSYALQNEINYQELNIDILIRGTKEQNKQALNLAEDVYNLFKSETNKTKNTTNIIVHTATPPLFAYQDEGERPIYRVRTEFTI